VTVNPILTASVSIVASVANPVPSGTSVTFTATPTNGGTAPVYQWYKGTTAVGSNSSTYSYVPANGDIIKVVMTSNATPCLVGSPVTSNSITVNVSPQGTRTTVLNYWGGTSVQYGSSVTLAAVLTYNGGGVRSKTITFTIGTQTKTVVTNSLGVASTTLVITQAPGNYQVVTTFAGDATYKASSDSDPFTITRRSLTAGLTGTVTKVYDGNTSVTNLTPANYTLSGKLSGDVVSISNTTGNYNNRNVGTGKQVTVTNLVLTGANANKYILSNTTVSGNIGIITASALASKAAEVVTTIQTIQPVSINAYPNPFTEKLVLEFSSPVSTHATLEIFNIAGSRLEILFDKEIKAGEMNEVDYFPNLVSSQVVLYHLTIGRKTYVGKMIYEEKR
jgi:hypothetical protein